MNEILKSLGKYVDHEFSFILKSLTVDTVTGCKRDDRLTYRKFSVNKTFKHKIEFKEKYFQLTKQKTK